MIAASRNFLSWLTRAPPAYGYEPAPKSELGRIENRLHQGTATPDEFLAGCQDAVVLDGVTPHEAKIALFRLAEGNFEAVDRARAGLNLVRTLEPNERAALRDLVEGYGRPGGFAGLLDAVLGANTPERRELERYLPGGQKAVRLVDSFERGSLVISDKDDTIAPSWKDRSVSGPVYPGAPELLAALDEGKGGSGVPGKVYFVTAAPNTGGFKLSAERDLARAQIRYAGVRHGSIASALRALVSESALVRPKVEAHEQILAANPGLPVFLFGDSGQQDEFVLSELLEKHGDRIQAALIHSIEGFEVPLAFSEHEKAIVFDDYPEAARALEARGLISAVQRERVERAYARAQTAETAQRAVLRPIADLLAT